jgi:hypothetical protein
MGLPHHKKTMKLVEYSTNSIEVYSNPNDDVIHDSGDEVSDLDKRNRV